jgi:signal transduction histidine kinase
MQRQERWIATVSHDLRQPLQAAQLYLGVLAAQQSMGGAQTVIQKLDNALSAATNLLLSQLDLSQIQAGLVRPEKVVFSLGALLNRLWEECAGAAEAKGLSLKVVQTNARPASDPGLIERIVRNLIMNAVRYTERGGVLVGCRRSGPDKIRIEVWDTGPGIPEAQRAVIFDEYVQLEQRPGITVHGFGLGLAFVREAAALLGHPVGLRSIVGQGSVFYVEVPCKPKNECRSRSELEDGTDAPGSAAA